MLNDRFNGGAPNEFQRKFRDKKFVSAVAIGIFVLILLIVLFARGCKSKPKPQPKPQPQVVSVAPETTVNVEPAVTNESDSISAARPEITDGSSAKQEKDQNYIESRKLIQEGRKYLNGNEKIKKDHKKARACFLKAKKLGHPDADFWLKKCK